MLSERPKNRGATGDPEHVEAPQASSDISRGGVADGGDWGFMSYPPLSRLARHAYALSYQNTDFLRTVYLYSETCVARCLCLCSHVLRCESCATRFRARW